MPKPRPSHNQPELRSLLTGTHPDYLWRPWFRPYIACKNLLGTAVLYYLWPTIIMVTLTIGSIDMLRQHKNMWLTAVTLLLPAIIAQAYVLYLTNRMGFTRLYRRSLLFMLKPQPATREERWLNIFINIPFITQFITAIGLLACFPITFLRLNHNFTPTPDEFLTVFTSTFLLYLIAHILLEISMGLHVFIRHCLHRRRSI